MVALCGRALDGRRTQETAVKILIADNFEPWGVDQLKGMATELVHEPGLKGAALKDKLQQFDPDVLVVRSTKVSADVLGGAQSLRLIIRAGSGVDTIDVKAASDRGIMVSNCPGANSAAVAELTMGLIIALDRRIPDNVADLRRHAWNKKGYSKGARGLKGRTLGIVGAGRIGTEVARRALAFDMNVLYFHLGRNLRLVDYPNCKRAELDDLLRFSDIITVHVPGGESTRHLLDERRLSLMKPHALLINTSRADVIDEAALIKALRSGALRGAAVDVYHGEPPADATEINSPLAEIPNLYGTHHIGASTEQAQLAVAEETVRIVMHYRGSGKILNCVNLQKPLTRCMLVVRLRNKPGGLAHVFQQISEAGINAEEMDHTVYDGGTAAVAHIRLDKQPNEQTLTRIREGHANVLGVELMTVD
jgi:D-3-phosphoglycerate dehydrogenase